jgi:inorganic pyrophosphatase
MYLKKNNKIIDPNYIQLKEEYGDKLYYIYENRKISPWHDIPLRYNNLFNFICEIPKWSRDKFEISTTDKYNPIIQDIEDGKPRVYNWGDTIFNYGALPQTWENPHIISNYTSKVGDNDPLDVIEIGLKKIEKGKITPVKIIGVIPLIDCNETDWKILAVSKDDILFDKINNISDMNKIYPDYIDAIINWLINYKSISKNIYNKIGMNGKIGDKNLANEIIQKTHNDWKKLLKINS